MHGLLSQVLARLGESVLLATLKSQRESMHRFAGCSTCTCLAGCHRQTLKSFSGLRRTSQMRPGASCRGACYAAQPAIMQLQLSPDFWAWHSYFLACVCCPDALRFTHDGYAHDLQPLRRFRSSSAQLPDRMSRTMLPPRKVFLLRRLKHAEGSATASWEAVYVQPEALLCEVPPMRPLHTV